MSRRLDLDDSRFDKMKPLEVEVGAYRSFEAAVKKFRKVVEKEGTIKQVLERRAFKKPSQIRHEKRRLAKRRAELTREQERLSQSRRGRRR
jgi:ribosomal protein S21